MFTISTERARIDRTHGSITIDYQRSHIAHCPAPATVADPADPIPMGPIIHDAEEVTS